MRGESLIIVGAMTDDSTSDIPARAETLRVLRFMGRYSPLLMLVGDDDGYGTRWTLSGQQVQPAIARFLMEKGLVEESGRTEFGARKLTLTEAGLRVRESGIRWWSGLSPLEKLKVVILG